MVNNKAIRQAIYTKLNVSSLTSLLPNGSAGIVHGIAPPTASYPICVFSKQSGVTTNRFGGEAFKSHLWLVKGIAKATSSSAAEDIDKAAYDLLHFGNLTITGADDMYLARESDVEYVETSGDTQFRHCGGLYRLVVQDS